MRGLTLRQPWAAAITYHGKRIENRTWWTRYAGPLAIHAGTGIDREGLKMLAADNNVHGRLRIDADEVYQQCVFGAVVAVADLGQPHYDELCCPRWGAEEEWHWPLTSVRVLAEPIPCRGALGLWRVPDHVTCQLTQQLTG